MTLTALEASHADRGLLEQLFALAFLLSYLLGEAILIIDITISDNTIFYQIFAAHLQ